MHAAPAPPAVGIRRRTLHESALGVVEDFSAPGRCPAPRGHSTQYQLVLPYAGAFEWRAGATAAFLDGTRALFVVAGEYYADRHVTDDGHDSIIITPRLLVLQELCGHAVPAQHPAFQCVATPATPRMNMRSQRLRHLDISGIDSLAGDELMLALLDEALLAAPGRVRQAPSPQVVDTAKQFLHAHLCEPMSLNDIARAVQVSGAYLTDAFTRSQGMPLCRYRMRLRLNRALVDLPACEDITRLALDLGFSSHAHFSIAFKSLFGLSPSAFRDGCGKFRNTVPPGWAPHSPHSSARGADLKVECDPKNLEAALGPNRQDELG